MTSTIIEMLAAALVLAAPPTTEPDLDKDGVPNIADRCPNAPEDQDGFEDDDGCPDPDNDKDGVPDIDDLCPMMPMTYNGHQDGGGCPVLPPHRIPSPPQEIHEKIYFATESRKLRSESLIKLDQIVKVLKQNPQLKRLRIEGHRDNAERIFGLRISNTRAKVVREYLISRGIEAARLEAQGYGDSRPLEANTTRQGRARNRRVDFHVIQE